MIMRKKGIFGAAILIFLFLSSGILLAKDIFVPLDYPSIQAGMDAAGEGDVVKVAQGTYAENIVMRQGVSLSGGYAPDFSGRDISLYTSVIDGGGKGPVVMFDHLAAGSIDGFRIVNGRADRGGGIFCVDSVSIIITNNDITGNKAFLGGGICGARAELEITNNIITHNSAEGKDPTPLMGGGIYCSLSNPIIKNNTISGNTSGGAGGGIALERTKATATVSNNIIKDNKAIREGGGIGIYTSRADIENNLISGNTGNVGGGVVSFKANPILRNNIIAGNSAPRGGGAIYDSKSSVRIVNSTLVRNSSDAGALYLENSSPDIMNSVFWENGDDLVMDFFSVPHITYSDINHPDFVGREGNIFLDPLFVALEAGNYRLIVDSPGVNAGDPSAELNDPDGTRNDMGAFGGPGAGAWAGDIPMIPVALSNSGWEDLGLYGGQILSVAIDPRDSEKFFAGSYMGDGLFVTNNNGTSWQTVEGFRNHNCKEVAISASDSNSVWVAFHTYIARSKDGGLSWSKKALPGQRYANSVAIDPVDNNTVYVGTGQRADGKGPTGTVLKTTDNGRTWQSTKMAAKQTVTRLAISRSDPRVLWAITGFNEPGVVFKSNNFGIDWQQIDIGRADSYLTGMVIHPLDRNIVFIAGSFGVIKTIDGGRSWKGCIEKNCTALTLDPNHPDLVYASIHDEESGLNLLYQSEDGGRTWQQHPLGNIYFYSLVVDPQHSDILLGGDHAAGVFKSFDNGATWQAINEKIRANIVYDSAFAPNSRDVLFVGTIGGLFRHDQDGNWTKLYPDPVSAVVMDLKNNNTIYAGVTGGLIKSTDNGLTWQKAKGFPSASPALFRGQDIAMDPEDQQILYVGIAYFNGKRGEVYKSTDSGQNFTRKKVFGVPVRALAVDPADSRIVYAGTSAFYASSGRVPTSGALFKSSDGGDRWTRLPLTEVEVNSIEIDPADSHVLYVGSGDSGGGNVGLYKSEDCGLTWDKKWFASSAVTDIRIENIIIDDPDPQGQVSTTIVYAATFQNGIFQSIDAGENWINLGLSDCKIFDISYYASYPSSAMEDASLTAGGTQQLVAGTNSSTSVFYGSQIYGFIIDQSSGKPVHNSAISVLLDGTYEDRIGTAFWTGAYHVLFPPEGHSILKCTAPNYHDYNLEINVDPYDIIKLNILLQKR